MANLMDLFAPTQVDETKFDITNIRTTAERIADMQVQVGGRPKLMAKVGSGGVKVFTVTNGNRDMVIESFKGVIIAQHKCNALFPSNEGNDTAVNTPPICSSVDGETGVVSETGECRSCADCPHNVFGSSGKGKACKNMHRLYVLTEDVPIPITLTLPPTSLELWRNYAIMDIAAAGLELNGVITEFGLTNAVNNSGQKYSIVNFRLVGKVNDEVKDFCKGIGAGLDGSPRPAIAAEEYNREALSDGLRNISIQNEPEENDMAGNFCASPDDDTLPDWNSGEVIHGDDEDEDIDFDAL